VEREHGFFYFTQSYTLAHTYVVYHYYSMLKEEFVIDRAGCVVNQVLGVDELGKE
jgi:hypothetical protein